MKKRFALLIVAITLVAPVVVASDRGQLLYENHCQSCHDKTFHQRKDRQATSPELLRAWVISMTVHNELQWSEEEVADITAYLDRTIYHFTE